MSIYIYCIIYILYIYYTIYISSNINGVIRAVLNSSLFYKKILNTHTGKTYDIKTKNKVLTSCVSLLLINKQIVEIVGSEAFIYCLYLLYFISKCEDLHIKLIVS